MDTTPLTILVVEHASFHAAAIRAAVNGEEEAGGRVLQATDLASGLEMAARETVDVLLLDLSSPDGGGLDAVHLVRELAPELAIVVITELDGDPAGALAMHGGAQDAVPRALLGHGVLLRSLRYAVDRYRMQRTLRQLSLTDELTGLYNRRGFVTLAEHHLRLAHRGRGLIAAVVTVEPLPDAGTIQGRASERSVVRAAEVLRATFRVSDVISRFGMVEFAVLAVDAPPSALPGIERRLVEQVSAPSTMPSLPAGLSFSGAFGVVPPQQGVDALLSQLSRLLAERQPVISGGH